MSLLLSKRRSRKSRQDAQDGKSLALTEAGIRLLARKDYDQISMAQIAREARCSVGAMYSRYSDKDVYLYRIIAHAFRNMEGRADTILAKERRQRTSAKSVVQQIVSHVVQEMTSPRGAGVIRAAMKLSTTKPLTQEPFEKYRTKVAELSADLLAGKIKQPRSAVRIGMQIVLGTITDAILQRHPGPMNAGSGRMTAALTNVLSGYLGFEERKSWAGNEADSEDDPDHIRGLGSETPPELGDGEIAIFDPDMRTYLGKRAGLQQKQLKRRKGITTKGVDTVGIAQKKPQVVKPSKAVAAKSAEPPDSDGKQLSTRSRRHRAV